MAIFRIIIIILGLFFYFNANSAHIVGGDVTYKCISSNPVTKTTRFRVTFTLYRDVVGGGAQFDNIARIGVFESTLGSNVWSHRQTINASPVNRNFVLYDDDCVVVPPNIIIEKGEYIVDVELPWGDNVFQIVYQRCCRNSTISNITSPGTTGAAFYVEIFGNAIQECNNSPVFNKFPPILICNQRMLNFDHSASQSEGNRLEYEFCTPLTAGGTDGATTPGSSISCTGVTPLPDNCLPPYREVEYTGGYSAQDPMNGNPKISIDPMTGIITGIPTSLGQFVVGICVNEFKNNVLIGSIRREFQFNVVVCQGVSSTKIIDLCEGDSVLVNDTQYFEVGEYTQVFQTDIGCDSILNIIIKEAKKSESHLTFKLCDDESVNVNDEIYTTSGTFTQVLTNKVGCDSIITISIEKYSSTESFINIQLCDGESGIVNDIVYNETGTFTQLRKNQNGCDSIININVRKGVSSFENKTFSLCDQNPVLVNGQSYNTPGNYTVELVTSSGCDSILNILILPCDQNILYDLEKCDALTPEKSMNYDEFTPAYIKSLNCGKIIASNIYRDNPQMNKHSCTPGFNNSKAMCVSASSSCNYAAASVAPIVLTFSMVPESGQRIQLNHLIFQQMSPLDYNWISGPTGPNNYPTKYGIKIFKNNQEVFRQTDIVASNDWTREKYDFFENEDFSTKDSAFYRIEILPYCPIGNGATVSVWDIDDVELYFSCHEVNNRVISGSIINNHSELSQVEIRRKFQNIQIISNIDSEGKFMMPKNSVDKTYTFEAYHNENTIYGVTTLDLAMTQRHILGIEPFTSPLQYLAADINNDQRVTASDLLQMRKLILGIDEYFKNNTSWIFLDAASVNSETNPWSIKRYISVPEGQKDIDHIRFVALKVGDVTGVLDIQNQNKE